MANPNHDPIFDYRLFSLTNTIHKISYPAISPSQPALSQAGKSVLITGASGGIGYAIARAFCAAGADKVIIVGRDEKKVRSSVEKLIKESNGSRTNFEGRACQISDAESIDSLWDDLDREGIQVDVLVLNAAKTDGQGKMWELGWKAVWAAFEVNVRSCHQFCDRFRGHGPAGLSKFVVNVSTSAIHDWPATENAPSYGLTKNSAALLLQQLARETQASDLQIVSFHPGAILTAGARAVGLDEASLDWDSVDLPGSIAVWAASKEAAFLHGRFFWASWDVEELQHGELRERIEQDEQFLRIGVHGLSQAVIA